MKINKKLLQAAASAAIGYATGCLLYTSDAADD